MIYWPVIGVIVFGFTTIYLEGVTEVPSLVVFLLGGLIVWTLFERVQQDVTIFLLEDFWSNNIANLFTTPVRLSEIFASLVIIGIIRAVITSAGMFLLALVAYHFNVIGGNISAVAFVIPLLLFGWALGILVTGIIFRYGPRIQIFAWGISYLVQPIGAVYYPLASLPNVLQKLALVTPLAYSFEGYRLAYAGTFSMKLFLAGCVLSLIYLALFYSYFVWAVGVARKKGTLAQY